MKLIKVDDNNVELAEGTLLVPEFKEIWESNKKDVAIEKIKFIWLYADYNSPYKQYTDEDRILKLEKDLKIKFTADIQKGVNKYKELTYTFNMGFLADAKYAAQKTREYFRSVDYTKIDVKGNPIYKGTDITKMLKDVTGVITSLDILEKKVETEQISQSKVKAGAKISKWEQ
jgi:hypothetical protein